MVTRATELVSRTPATVGDVLDFLDRANDFIPAESMATAIFPGFLKGASDINEWNQKRSLQVALATMKLASIAASGIIQQKKRMLGGVSVAVFGFDYQFKMRLESPSMRDLLVRELADTEDTRLVAERVTS